MDDLYALGVGVDWIQQDVLRLGDQRARNAQQTRPASEPVVANLLGELDVVLPAIGQHWGEARRGGDGGDRS